MPEKKFVSKIAVYFQVPVDLANRKEVAEGYNLLIEQIVAYAEALKKDRNVIIADSIMISDPSDYANRADTPVDVHIAELMATRTSTSVKVPTAKTPDLPPLPDILPTAKSAKTSAPKVEEPEDEDTEGPQDDESDSTPEEVTPHIQSIDVKALAAKAKAKVDSEPKPSELATTTIKIAKPVDVGDEDVNLIVEGIFKDLKRTEKSVKIVTALAKAGGEITLRDLEAATTLSSTDVTSWMATTGKKIPAVESTGRGKYRLNPDKV